jgi:hypothetical protein
MELAEAEKMVTKVMRVIVSCETKQQLETACRYSDLAYRLIAGSGVIGLTDKIKFSGKIERSIGFAICNTK